METRLVRTVIFFMAFRSDDSLIRVPLWIKLPSSERGGSRAKGCASLIDVYPTVLESAGIARSRRVPVLTLRNLFEESRPGPAIAISDGVVNRRQARKWLPKPIFDSLDVTKVAVYFGGRKLVLTTPPERVENQSDAGQDLSRNEDPNAAPIAVDTFRQLARWVAARMRSGHFTEPDAEVVARLNAWGYT